MLKAIKTASELRKLYEEQNKYPIPFGIQDHTLMEHYQQLVSRINDPQKLWDAFEHDMQTANSLFLYNRNSGLQFLTFLRNSGS